MIITVKKETRAYEVDNYTNNINHLGDSDAREVGSNNWRYNVRRLNDANRLCCMWSGIDSDKWRYK